MSILQPEPTTPEQIAAQKAEQIINRTVRSSRRLIKDWEKSIEDLWDHPQPQAILDALGTDAAEVFELSTAVIQLMSAILPGKSPADWARVQQQLAKIQPATVNEDGTVTIN